MTTGKHDKMIPYIMHTTYIRLDWVVMILEVTLRSSTPMHL